MEIKSNKVRDFQSLEFLKKCSNAAKTCIWSNYKFNLNKMKQLLTAAYGQLLESHHTDNKSLLYEIKSLCLASILLQSFQETGLFYGRQVVGVFTETNCRLMLDTRKHTLPALHTGVTKHTHSYTFSCSWCSHWRVAIATADLQTSYLVSLGSV